MPRARGRKRGESRRGRFDFCCNPSLCFREDALQVKETPEHKERSAWFPMHHMPAQVGDGGKEGLFHSGYMGCMHTPHTGVVGHSGRGWFDLVSALSFLNVEVKGRDNEGSA